MKTRFIKLKGKTLNYAEIDAEDYRRVSRYEWRVDYNVKGQPVIYRRVKAANNKYKQIRLSHFILGLTGRYAAQISYVNGDRYDHRKSNLKRIGDEIKIYLWCDNWKLKLGKRAWIVELRGGNTKFGKKIGQFDTQEIAQAVEKYANELIKESAEYREIKDLRTAVRDWGRPIYGKDFMPERGAGARGRPGRTGSAQNYQVYYCASRPKPWNLVLRFNKKNFSCGYYSTKEVAEAVGKFAAPMMESFLDESRIEAIRAASYQWAAQNNYRPKSQSGFPKSGNKAKPVGSERISKRGGYREVKVAGQRCWVGKHRLVWEAANGKLEPKQKLTFKDGNPLNCDLDNLCLFSRAGSWTEPEIDDLKTLYPNSPNPEIAERLNKSQTAVMAKAHKLGLAKDGNYLKTIRQKRAQGKGFWNAEKCELITQIYATTSNPEIAEMFGCPVSAIPYIARKLKLKKAGEWCGKRKSNPNKPVHEKKMPVGRQRAEQFGFDPKTAQIQIAITRGGKVYQIHFDDGKKCQLHRYLWEREFGEIPENHIIVFRDGNRLNCELENFELIDPTEHYKCVQMQQYPDELKDVVGLICDLNRTIKDKGGNRARSNWANWRNKQAKTKTSRATIGNARPGNNPRWSEADFDYLKNNYGKLSTKEIADQLNRSIGTVYAVAYRLKLTNPALYYGDSQVRVWTPENLQILKELYPDNKNQEIADVIGKHKDSVSKKARELGLSKNAEFISQCRKAAGSQPRQKNKLNGETYAKQSRLSTC